MISQKVLLVDDDPNVLRGYKRNLRKQFEIETALCSEEALTAANFLGPFAVIVSDMNMPRENGVQLLQRFLKECPNSVRIMLTGNADQQTATDAINKGQVFRFLNKPCKSAELGEAITAAIEHHRLITAERELLTKTVLGSVNMMTEILSTVNPIAFGHASRLRRLAGELAKLANVDRPWECEIAALLSQVGCVSLPHDVLEKEAAGQSLTAEEETLLANRFNFGSQLIGEIPRLESVAHIVACQDPKIRHQRPADEISLATHLLHIARDFDQLCQQGLEPSLAFVQIDQQVDHYATAAVDALRQFVERQPEYEQREIDADELEEGWLLAADVKTADGMLLVKAGQEVTNSLLMQIQNHSSRVEIQGPLTVLVPIVSEVAEITSDDLALA
ncbi:MAG: HD domain-containing phosphohydrolase [Planctomycetota bacterium]